MVLCVFYRLLGIGHDADEKAINKAFKKAALKAHPDKNKNDPKAQEKFEALVHAKERLLDPKVRAELEQKAKAKQEARARFEKQDGKRRKLQEELEKREKEAEENAMYARRTGTAAQERMRRENRARMNAAASDRLRRERDLNTRLEETKNSDRRLRSLKIKLKSAPAFPLDEMRKKLEDLEDISIESDGVAIARFMTREAALSGCLTCKRNKEWGVKASMLASAATAQSSYDTQSEVSQSVFECDDSALDALKRVSFASRVRANDHMDMSDTPTSTEPSQSDMSDTPGPDMFARIRAAAAKQKSAKEAGVAKQLFTPEKAKPTTIEEEEDDKPAFSAGRKRERSPSPPVVNPTASSTTSFGGGGGSDLMAKLRAAAAKQAAAKQAAKS